MPRRPDLDDLDREMRDHIEAETEENIARGMAENDARAAAIRKFGNVTRIKEDVRGVWIPGWLDRLRQDARDALRYVRRNPAFSLAIVITLTLGIGLTTAIYTVVNAVLIRPLAYQHPERMVWLTTVGKSGRESMNSIDFGAWQAQATLLEHIVAYDYSDSTIVIGGEASRARIVQASDGFWQITGAQPMLGTLPAANDLTTIALSHQAYRDQFHSDRNVIGRVVSIDGREATVAAVLPADFRPQLMPHVFQREDYVEPAAYRMLPIQPPPQAITPQTQVRLYSVLGELKRDVTVPQARAEITAIHARQAREHPTPFGPSTAVVAPLRERMVGPSRRALGVLLAAALVLLSISCANVANLLLSRSAERRKEIALRMSVGSSPSRIVRQLLAESLAYALLGGIGGILLASWLVNLVIVILGPALPRLTEARLDLGVLAVTAAVAVGTALLFGAGPALALIATNMQEVLKEGGRTVSATRRVLMTGRVMVALQLALTMILLAGAGLMFKSVWQMTRYPAGFAPDHILTMRLDFKGPQYRDQRLRHTFTAALLEKANTLPGVGDAAITTFRDGIMLVMKEGDPIPQPSERGLHEAPESSISASFGPMIGMSLAKGRWFTEHEAPGAIIINESLARREFGDRDPIGRRIRLPFVGAQPYGTVVGVARDMKYAAIDEDPSPEIFFNHADNFLYGITLLMRIDGDPVAAAPAIRKALSTIDPSQSFYLVRTMEQALAESIAPRRFNLLLLGTFALVACVLAVLGVYGVVAYAVAERRQEIGIRLALGAERARVVRMIVAQGMSSVIAGLVAGVIGAAAATRVIAGLLYGVAAHDLPTFVIVTAGLSVVAFLACTIPALEAAAVDPAAALRAE
jgi:putative ABC transport system permease protein